MTNDHDVLNPLRDALSGLHMRTPVEEILHRAGAHRRRRRAALGATVAAGAAAALIAVGVGVDASGHAPPAQPVRPAPPAGPQPGGPRLAAFTLTSSPGGAASLTLRKGGQWQVDAAALRSALAGHGIPALVTVGRSCDSSPEPAGLDQVITSNRQTDGNVEVTFDPAALPPGAEISIGLFPAHTRLSLIDGNAPLHCSTDPGRAATPAP